jgi:hypothetical protein
MSEQKMPFGIDTKKSPNKKPLNDGFFRMWNFVHWEGIKRKSHGVRRI